MSYYFEPIKTLSVTPSDRRGHMGPGGSFLERHTEVDVIKGSTNTVEIGIYEELDGDETTTMLLLSTQSDEGPGHWGTVLAFNARQAEAIAEIALEMAKRAKSDKYRPGSWG